MKILGEEFNIFGIIEVCFDFLVTFAFFNYTQDPTWGHFMGLIAIAQISIIYHMKRRSWGL